MSNVKKTKSSKALTDTEILNLIQREGWAVAPQLGGGWVVEWSFGEDDVGSFGEGKGLDLRSTIRAMVDDNWNPREINKARQDWVKINAAKAEIWRLTRERDELRRICIAAVNATDGACGDTVSTEFLAHLPREIEAMKVERDRLREMFAYEQRARLVAARERDEAMALVVTMREAAAVLLDNDGGEGSSCYNAGRRYDAREALKEAIAAAGPAALAEVQAKALEAVADGWAEMSDAAPAPVAVFVAMLRMTADNMRARAERSQALRGEAQP